MNYIVKMITNREFMLLYHFINLCIGSLLLINPKKNIILKKVVIYIICFANGLWGGSLILLNWTSWFLACVLGALSSLLILLFIWKRKKEFINYVFSFWSVMKIGVIILNYFVLHDIPEIELKIFTVAAYIAVVVSTIVYFGKIVFHIAKKKLQLIEKLSCFFSVFYGSIMIVGSLFELIKDAIVNQLKFLGDKGEYINFYKVIWKVDWTQEGDGFFFLMLFIIFLFAGALSCVLKKEKENYC